MTNQGNSKGIANHPSHKCGECREMPPDADHTFCAVKQRVVRKGETACVMGRSRG